jgi:hypothetical protein
MILKQKITLFILLFLSCIISIFIWLSILKCLRIAILYCLIEFSFIILIYICIKYIRNLIALLHNKNSNTELETIIITYLYKPLKILNIKIKSNNIVKPYYERYLTYFIGLLNHINENNYLIFCIIIEIIPRSILLIALGIDIFYFHEICLLYLLGIFTIIIIINYYNRYTLNYAKEQYILRLEYIVDSIMTNYNKDEPEAYIGSFISIRKFIELQTYAIVDS